jgi:hypothetical protein
VASLLRFLTFWSACLAIKISRFFGALRQLSILPQMPVDTICLGALSAMQRGSYRPTVVLQALTGGTDCFDEAANHSRVGWLSRLHTPSKIKSTSGLHGPEIVRNDPNPSHEAGPKQPRRLHQGATMCCESDRRDEAMAFANPAHLIDLSVERA